MSKFLLRSTLPTLIIVGSLGLPVANANEALSLEQGGDLVKRSACLGCHAIDKKRLGPSFQQIAQRYAGQTDAQALLTASIRNGGANKWGAVPMPAQRHVSEDNAKLIASWILTLKTE